MMMIIINKRKQLVDDDESDTFDISKIVRLLYLYLKYLFTCSSIRHLLIVYLVAVVIHTKK